MSDGRGEAHESRLWLWLLVGGGVLVALGLFALPHDTWAEALAQGVGGLLVVFAASETMIKAVEGVAGRTGMNTFVAGNMAGLASNIPELVMLAFVLLATPRVGFLVTLLTLHVGAAAFGLYSGLLPRDAEGGASMPAPLVKLSTDLYAAAAGVFFGVGVLMLLMKTFAPDPHAVQALDARDLYVLGAMLLGVQVVAIVRMVRRFSGSDEGAAPQASEGGHGAPMSVAAIAGFSVLGLAASVVGGHAVGDFADFLVGRLNEAGYPEMLGALLLSVFSASGAFVMIGMAHAQKKYDIALANASGAVTQVPFLVLPIAMILLAAFHQTGVIPSTGEGVIAIDLHTTSATLLAFPSMLVLWKAIQDDGKVNWVETATMSALFLLVIYLLVGHG